MADQKKTVPPTKPGAPQGGQPLSAASLQAKMTIPEKAKGQFQRIIVAGMKVMFDQQSHGMMLKQLSGPGAMPEKLGVGIAGLLGILQKESNNTLPPQLFIPAGIVLMAHAVEFLNKAGQQVSDTDFGMAVGIMVDKILGTFKVDSNKVMANIDSRTKKQTEVSPLVGNQAPGAAMPQGSPEGV